MEQSARGVVLNSQMHLVSGLGMSGVLPPFSLHAFMAWKGINLLYFSTCLMGLELMKNRQLCTCEKLIWSCLSSISINIPEKQRQFSEHAVTRRQFWRDSIVTRKWPLVNILKAKHLPKCRKQEALYVTKHAQPAFHILIRDTSFITSPHVNARESKLILQRWTSLKLWKIGRVSRAKSPLI